MFEVDYIYVGTALDAAVSTPPGSGLASLLSGRPDSDYALRKVEQSCRKLCLMWQAGDYGLEAEEEVRLTSYRDAVGFYGDVAIQAQYHLEALVLFARSALDVSSGAFGLLLPAPFPRGRFDSFNDLLKAIEKHGPEDVWSFFEPLRTTRDSWVSITTGSQRGRSLRDKIVHQTDFPIDYVELFPPSEREYPVVRLDDDKLVPLEDFVRTLRTGVLEGFAVLENACVVDPTAADSATA